MNRTTKILFCSVLAVISFLCLGAVFTAPPPFWRNAWSTNQPPRAVTGVNNLTVSNFNSTTGWQFWAVGPKTVARLGDVTGIVNAASSPGLTTNANQFLGVPLSIKDNARLTNTIVEGTNSIAHATRPAVSLTDDTGLVQSQYYFDPSFPFAGFYSADATFDVARLDANGVGSQGFQLWGSGGGLGGIPDFIANRTLCLDLLSGDTNKLVIARAVYFHAIGIDIGASEKVYISTNGIKLIGLTASRAAVIGAAGYITNATGTPDGTMFLRDDNTYAVPPGTSGLTTNANQFLGVPLSLKDGVQVTNLTNSGVLTGAIGVFTQETNSGNLTMTAVTPSIIDGFGMTRVTIPKNTSITIRGTNGSITFLVDKDGKGVTIGTNLSLGSTPVAKLEILSDPTLYQIRVCTNNFVVTNFLVGIGTAVPLSKLHVTNSTAQTNVRIDQQNTTNPIVQFYNNNTLTSEFTTNGFSTFTSNLLAPTGITAPATTVKWTNPIPENIEVYIDNSGVTGTAIQKNGTTIFTSLVGDVTIGLQRGEFISLTYSVGTPSIKWSPR